MWCSVCVQLLQVQPFPPSSSFPQHSVSPVAGWTVHSVRVCWIMASVQRDSSTQLRSDIKGVDTKKQLWWIGELLTPLTAARSRSATPKEKRGQFVPEQGMLTNMSQYNETVWKDLPGNNPDEEVLSYCNQLDQRGLLPPNRCFIVMSRSFVKQYKCNQRC